MAKHAKHSGHAAGGRGQGAGPGGDYLACTRTTSPSASDASTKLKGASVNSGATRDGTLNYTTQNPALGPRTA